MMHRLCVCVCVSRVCLCTVRVCCGSDSAWSLTRILICFCYFPPDSLFTFLPCPLFEQEVQFHSSGEAHTYSFFFFFFAHTFSTHTSASTHAAFNEKRASTSALNLYAITPPLGFALRSVWTHLKSVQFTFVHIFVFLICMCALLPVDHDYIISMHFIKLYKVKGNAPVFFDCCYGITHNWTSWEPQKTKKQHFLSTHLLHDRGWLKSASSLYLLFTSQLMKYGAARWRVWVRRRRIKAAKRKPVTGRGHKSRKCTELSWTAGQSKGNKRCERRR